MAPELPVRLEPVEGAVVDRPLSLYEKALRGCADRKGVFPYNSSAATLLAHAAFEAYADSAKSPERLKQEMQRLGMGENVEFQAYSASNSAAMVDTQAFFVGSEDKRLAIVVFRGTECATGENIDLLTDIDAKAREFPPSSGARVHLGFYNAFAYVWRDLARDLDRVQDKYEFFLFTGHSLGAALAVLAASAFVFDDRFCRSRKKLRGLYTFGQPMVGDEVFAALGRKYLGAQTFRHVYQRDWVPRLPPRSTGHFVHFGAEYHGTSTQPWSFRQGATEQAWFALWSGLIAFAAFIAARLSLTRQLPFVFSLDDHLPINYVNCSELARAEIFEF